MSNLLDEVVQTVKTAAVNWAAVAGLAGFALYLLGYLVLRFHLTALGVGTDIVSLVDERYLFAGAKFLVYLCACVPSLLLLALFASVLIWLLAVLYYVPYRVTRSSPLGFHAYAGEAARGTFRLWVNPQSVLAGRLGADAQLMVGIVLSVLLIQFFMRHCFFFTDLLMRPALPDTWFGLETMLVEEDEATLSLYFGGLVAVLGLNCLLLFGANVRERAASRFLTALFGFLLVVQFLLLAVNYGVLVVDKQIPRVASLDGENKLEDSQRAWLVWEGAEGKTYFVRGCDQGVETRRLITLPRASVKRTEVVASDDILKVLYGGVVEPARAAKGE